MQILIIKVAQDIENFLASFVEADLRNCVETVGRKMEEELEDGRD